MSKITKRITAMLLAGMLVIGSVSGSVFAASTDVDPGQTSEIVEEVFAEDTSEEPVTTTEGISEAVDEVLAEEDQANTSEKSAAVEEGAFDTSVVQEDSSFPIEDVSSNEIILEESNSADTSYDASVEETAQYYTITLDANGGYFENEWDDSIGEYAQQAEVVEKHIPVDGTIVAFPVFIDQDGQSMGFAGWSLERDGELVSQAEEEYIPVDDCVLYAVWQAEDASLGETEVVTDEDADVADSELEAEAGYKDAEHTEEEDVGFGETAEEADSAQEYEDAETVKEIQEETGVNGSYNVILDANGGYFLNEWDDALGEYVESAKMLNKIIPVDGTVATFPAYEEEGLTVTFLGWSLERDGELVSQNYEEYTPIESCVLYAVWEIEEVADDKGTDESEDFEEMADAETVMDAESDTEPGTNDVVNTETYEDEQQGDSSEESDNIVLGSESAKTQNTTESSTTSKEIQEDIGNPKPGHEAEGTETEVKEDEAEHDIVEEKAYKESVSSDPMLSSEPVIGAHMWYQYNGNIDVRGYTGSSTIQTTYSNNGYCTVLQCDGNKETLQFNQNGQFVAHTSGLTVTPVVEFSSDGKYAIVRYTVKNTSASTKTYSLGVCADVDIDSDDHASVYRTNNGLRMVDRSSGRTYYLVCKNINGATSAGTLWFGYYGDRFDNLFNSTSDSELTGVDSGLAFSWKDQVLSAGSTTSYVYQIGIGEAGAIDDYDDTWHIIQDGIDYDFFFKVGEDTNHFYHHELPYKFDDVSISNELFLSTFPNLRNTRDLIKYLDGNPGGVCHGIAMSMCYGNQGFLDFKSISNSASNYWQLGDPQNKPAFKDLLLYYELTQLSKGGGPSKKIDKDGWHIKSLDTRLEEFLTALVGEAQKCSTSKKPFVFGFKENGGGHSVVVCGYIWNKTTKNHEIVIYDENSYDGREGHYSLMKVPEDCKSFDFADANAVIDGYTIQDVWTSLSYFGIDKIYGSSNILRKSAASGGDDGSATTFQISVGKAFRIEDENSNWISYDGTNYLGNMNVYDCYISGLDDAPYWNITIDTTSKLTLKEFEPGCELSTQIDGKGYVVSSDGADSVTIQSDGVTAEGESYTLDVYVQPEGYDILQVQASCEGRTTFNSVDGSLVVSSTGKCDNVKAWVYDQTVSEEYYTEINENGEVIIDLASNEKIVDSGLCGDNIRWSLTNAGSLSFYGTGKMKDFPYVWGGTPWYYQNVKKVIIGEGITSIGDYAFCDSAMTSIKVPESLESIGVSAFSGCTGLTSFHIPPKVSFIGQNAFAGPGTSSASSKMVMITVDEDNPFFFDKDGVVFTKDEKSLVTFPPGRVGAFIIPNGVQVIEATAFSGCKGLSGISFPETLEEIGSYAFCSTGLTEVVIPESVKSIGESVFSNCRSLKEADIGAPVNTLQNQLFSCCFELETIFLTESIKMVESNTFFDCRALKDIYFGGSERTWRKVVIEQGRVYDTYFSDATVHFAKENEISVMDKSCVSIKVDDQIWTGKPLTPAVDVKYENDSIIEGTDYEVSYANNTNVGTATVTITGAGYYTGIVSKTFKISGRSIANATVSGIVNKTYTGSANTQNPTVKVGERTLKKGTDYTLSYANNTNVGTATVTITGKGNYASKKTATFKINKASQSITAKAGASKVTVGKTTTVSITGGKGKKSYKSSNTAIATVTSAGKVTAKKVGTVKITATSAATANYKAASKTVTIKVVPAATASLAAANQATGIKLTWKKVTGANGYKVYRGSTLIKTLTSGSTVTFTDTKANTNGTKYNFKVVAKAATGDSTLSKTRGIYRVARAAVSSVKNSASKKMTVKWGKNAKGNGYQIQYSTSKTFASGNKVVAVAGASTVSKVIGSLTKGKTYYVRVRAYKTANNVKFFSAWSTAKSVKISK